MANKKKKTRAQLEAENEFLRKGDLIKGVTTITKSFFRWGGIAAIAYFTSKSVIALSGKNTVADIDVIGQFTTDSLQKTPIAHIISYIAGVMGVTYGILQRQLRKRVIEKFESQKTIWEEQTDPGRKSSLLTKNGTTRPEDE